MMPNPPIPITTSSSTCLIRRFCFSTWASRLEKNSRSVIFHLSVRNFYPIHGWHVQQNAQRTHGFPDFRPPEAQLLVLEKIRRGSAVRKTAQSQFVYSKPTMCLHCHLIVEMIHERDADPAKGAWQCPQCGHIYPFVHWKIRKQAPRRSEAA